MQKMSDSKPTTTESTGKRFTIPLEFEFFKQPACPYFFHKDLTVTIELNKPKKAMLWSGDTGATYTISNIALEYDGIINAVYTEKSF